MSGFCFPIMLYKKRINESIYHKTYADCKMLVNLVSIHVKKNIEKIIVTVLWLSIECHENMQNVL